ncbi:unnamed protein product [Closterium sp. Yama58-4]|nr:unnamed protein product [Closterium sp. Yama58-4]
MRVMQLLDNDKPCNAVESDPSARITTGPTRWIPVGAQPSPRQQLGIPSHRRGPPRLSLQLSEGYEYDVTTPNSRASRTPSSWSFSSGSKSSSASPRLAASLSSSSVSTGSPNNSSAESPYNRPLDSPSYSRRPTQIRHDIVAANGHVGAIRHSASTSALEPPSSVRRSSSGTAARRKTKTSRENYPEGPDQLGAARARATDISSSADTRAAARAQPGLRMSSETGGGAATRLTVPQSRRLRHNDTWHGESLDRVAIPRARTDVVRSSHHLSLREAPRLQLHHAATSPGGQSAEPASCAPHHPSPRSSGGSAVTRGILKSGSDTDLAARESNYAKSTTLTRVMPSTIAAAVDTRYVLKAQPQPPNDRARGPTTTQSRQIRRPAALVIDCDAGDDDDVAEPTLSARNHHASPASHSRHRRERRSSAGPGANHHDQLPAGVTTVGRAQRGRRSAVAQASSPSSASPLDSTSPSPTSPRFPCGIPSPRLLPLATPTAYQQSPRQQLQPSTSLGGSSPAIHRQSTIATGSPSSQPAATRGQRKGGDSQGSSSSSSRQLSRFHTWDNALLDGEPSPQITPPPVPPSCREHRPRRKFSGRQNAEVPSEQLWAEGADWEEGDWRGADGGGAHAVAATAHAAAPHTGPVTRWRSHSLQDVQPPVAEHPMAEHGIAEHLVAFQDPIAQHPIPEHAIKEDRTARHRCSCTLDRRPAPSASLPDCRLLRRPACDKRAARHARGGSHGGAGVHVQRADGIDGAGVNAQWVGKEDEDWGIVQETPWKVEDEGEDVEAMRRWEWDAEGAGLERGGVERHGSMLSHAQHAALVPDLRDGPTGYQQSAPAVESLEGSKQQIRPRGRPDGQKSSENAGAGEVRGSESKGSSKSKEKPKSKLQRSLSDDDEEEEQAKAVVRPSRGDSGRPKQQRKKGALRKA